MTTRDLPAAEALSREVGWPHRLEDWQLVHALGEGLVVCAGDRLVGTAMWWRYGGKVVRIGMVIVAPTIQRLGIGRALMRAALDRIAEPAVLLNATRQGETLYRQLGFRALGSIAQHQGVPAPTRQVSLRMREAIRPAHAGDLHRFVEIDAAAGGAPRDGVIAAVLARGEAVALAAAGGIAGFACYRPFGRGHLIGPVVARDDAGARALIAHAIDANAGKFLRIDVPVDSGLPDWLEGLGLARVDTVVAMVRGAAPQRGNTAHAFGLVNQALG
jgi:predicted N-acetyltransferase YhbS